MVSGCTTSSRSDSPPPKRVKPSPRAERGKDQPLGASCSIKLQSLSKEEEDLPLGATGNFPAFSFNLKEFPFSGNPVLVKAKTEYSRAGGNGRTAADNYRAKELEGTTAEHDRLCYQLATQYSSMLYSALPEPREEEEDVVMETQEMRMARVTEANINLAIIANEVEQARTDRDAWQRERDTKSRSALGPRCGHATVSAAGTISTGVTAGGYKSKVPVGQVIKPMWERSCPDLRDRAAAAALHLSTAGPRRLCSKCHESLPEAAYSGKQWKKGTMRRCMRCMISGH